MSRGRPHRHGQDTHGSAGSSPVPAPGIRPFLRDAYIWQSVKAKRNKWATILLHVSLWLIFLCIPHYFFGYIVRVADVHTTGPPIPAEYSHSRWFDLVFVIFNTSYIAFYYLNSLVLIPRLLSRRLRMWYVLSILLSMVIIVSLPSIVIRFHDPGKYIENPYDTYRVLIRVLFTTLLFAIIFIISSGMRIVYEWYRAEEQARDIQLEQTVTELSLLKAQLNPHFLFNTLNNIYSLSLRKSDDTPKAVMMLADLMRYVLSDAQSEHVPLERDLQSLTEYVELQRLRLTSKVSIRYTQTGDVCDRQIAPLILMPFVENAFKYGISTHEQSAIEIGVHVDGDQLTTRVSNRLMPQSHLMQRGTGTGLANVRRRLELLYPSRHTLDIETDADGYYKVFLQINLA